MNENVGRTYTIVVLVITIAFLKLLLLPWTTLKKTNKCQKTFGPEFMNNFVGR